MPFFEKKKKKKRETYALIKKNFSTKSRDF